MFQLVSVAEETGLSLALPETQKTWIVTSRPINDYIEFSLDEAHS